MSATVFHQRNIIILLGVVITGVALVYLATEFLERISEWGRVLSLALITVMLMSLGRHFEVDDEGALLVEKPGWHWLRVTSAFYLLAILAALTGVIVFLGVDSVDPILKALVALGIGLGLILLAARRLGRK